MSAVLPLSHLIPLRKTSAWGTYATDKAIPVVYGTARLTPVPADRDGYTFCLADHPIDGVESVTRDNVAEYTWIFKQGPDATGKIVSWLHLNEPLKPNEQLAAVVRGKQHQRTGALLQNPADILWDVLAGVCGLSVVENDFSAFRSECAAAGIELSGVISNAGATIRATIDSIMQSAGAVWSGSMPGFAKLYPGGTSAAVSFVFDSTNMASVKSISTADAIATETRLAYHLDWHTDATTRSVIVSAPQARKTYGGNGIDCTAHWLTNPRQALNLANRILKHRGRPVWQVAWTGGLDCKHLLPGDTVSITHPLVPISGSCMLLSVETDIFGGTVSMSAEMYADVSPVVELTGSASAWQPVAIDGVTINYTNGVATFTILNEQNNPLAGASVTIDGGTKRTTDKAGRVQFSTGRGKHVLQISASGYATFTAEVTV